METSLAAVPSVWGLNHRMPCRHRVFWVPGRALGETDRRLTLLEQYLDGIRVLRLGGRFILGN